MHTFIELVDKRHISIHTSDTKQGVKGTPLHFPTPKEAKFEFWRFIHKHRMQGEDVRQLHPTAFMIVH